MPLESKKIMILAGGGGHTSIAVALAQILHKNVDISFLVPEKDWLSYKLLGRYGEVDYIIKPRSPFTPNYFLIIRFLLSFIQSFFKVKGDLNLVVSCGSNFCIPPALVAWMKGVPIVNIESRVAMIVPSKTAKILQNFSIVTILQWEEQRENLKGILTGPIFQKPEIKPWSGGYILVTGGTQGHRKLFNLLINSDLENIVLQTGKLDPSHYKKKHPEWKVFSFSENFQRIVAGADILITHQGGGTIFEAIMYNKPLIIVYNPDLKRTASKEEIELLSKKINAVFLTEYTLDTVIDEIYKVREQFTPVIFNGSKNLGKLIINLLKK